MFSDTASTPPPNEGTLDLFADLDKAGRLPVPAQAAEPPKLALILDTETSSAEPERCELVEVGAVLYDLELAAVVSCFATVVAAGGNGAEAINGVPAEMVTNPYAPSRAAAMERIIEMASKAMYVVAHNASFDRTVLAAELGDRTWVCTQHDVEWPAHVTGRRLVDIALQMGVGVVRAHRALEDCLTLANVLDRLSEGGIDLPKWLQEAATATWVRVVAHVSYANNGLAKAAGFSWDATRKEWWRRVREDQVTRVRAELAEVRVTVSVHADRR